MVTEGNYHPKGNQVTISQSDIANPEKTERIRELVKYFRNLGATVSEYNYDHQNAARFYFGKGIGKHIRECCPDKQLTVEFLTSLTEAQAWLLFDTLIAADGHIRHDGKGKETRQFVQKDKGRVDSFQMLCAMLGIRSHSRLHENGCNYITAYHKNTTVARGLNAHNEYYNGIVWCPQVDNRTFFARHNGVTYWTSNTYVEIITDETIEEYVNDQLIDQRPNPLGLIPVVHIANTPVPATPWGLGRHTGHLASQQRV